MNSSPRMNRLWVGLVIATACSKPAEMNPTWLAEQTSLVDAMCTCTNAMKTKEKTIPDTNEAYTALLAETENCVDATRPSSILVYKAPSGVEPNVPAEELYQRKDVRLLEIKMNACRQELAERVNMLSPAGRQMMQTAQARTKSR